VALCQMVPGPASSQVGYLIGLRRAGWSGALAAWAGFTLPSALVMFAFALLAPHLEGPATNAVLHGLKLVAVAVVAQAVIFHGTSRGPASIGMDLGFASGLLVWRGLPVAGQSGRR
jgi:chromate transport protein ChrA